MKLDLNQEELDELTSQVLKEYGNSFNSFSQKKQLFRDRQPLYVNINRNEMKLNVNSIRGLVISLLALYYQDKMQVQFQSRNIFTWDYAYNWNKIAESDYDELGMDQTDFTVQKNRFIYGVGIRFFHGWDDDLKAPKFSVISPMDWRPDPEGHTSPDNFAYMGFDREMSIEDVKREDWQYNARDLYMKLSNQQYLNNWAKKNSRLIVQQAENGGTVEEPSYNGPLTVYYHMTTFDDMPVQVAMFNSIILEVNHLEPLDKEYSKNTGKMCKVKFPVALNYREPHEGDPFGISVVDLAEDKQKLRNLLMNLMKDKAVRQALGGTMFIDRDTFVSNKAELIKKSVGPKYIPVSTPIDGGVQKLVYKTPEDNIPPDVYNMPPMLDQEMKMDVGIGDQTRGVASAGAQTATESQYIQQNQNINLVLGNRVNGWGEKQFWSVMYLYYKYYFSPKDKKFVRYSSGSSAKTMFVTREQIIEDVDPDITIMNRSEMDMKNKQELIQMQSIIPLMMESPLIPKISKLMFLRKLFIMQGKDKNEVETDLVALTPEEEDAYNQVQLLNRNIPITVDNQNEDHLTYMIVYKRALDTPAKKAALEMRKQLYILSGQAAMQQQQQMDPQTGGLANSVGNQVASANIASQMKTAGMQQL